MGSRFELLVSHGFRGRYGKVAFRQAGSRAGCLVVGRERRYEDRVLYRHWVASHCWAQNRALISGVCRKEWTHLSGSGPSFIECMSDESKQTKSWGYRCLSQLVVYITVVQISPLLGNRELPRYRQTSAFSRLIEWCTALDQTDCGHGTYLPSPQLSDPRVMSCSQTRQKTLHPYLQVIIPFQQIRP